MPPQALMWHNIAMVRLWLQGGLAGGPQHGASACGRRVAPDARVECFPRIGPENRERPEAREVRLKVAVLKAKRTAGAEPMFYLSGGPGDAPLVASTPGADPLAE